MRLQRKISLLFASVLVVAFTIIAWFVDRGLRADLDEAAAQQLRDAARLAAVAIGDEAFSDSLADRLARGTRLRVTLMAPDGSVLGDSEVPTQRLPSVENHAERPEVKAALSGREGIASRPSETVSRRLMYLAVPHEHGVIRLSVPIDAQRLAAGRVRGGLILGGALTLLLALAFSRIVIRLLANALRRVRATAEAITAGDLTKRSRPVEQGEIGALERAIDEMADRIESLVSDLTQEKADLDALFESLDDGLAVLDRTQAVVRANRAFRKIVGRDDVEGERVGALFRTPELRELAERAASGEAVIEEVLLRDRTMLLSGIPHGEGALLVFRDLTPLRRLEGVRRDFVANVSHELKTPLTSVMGFAEPIADGDAGPEEARAFGGRILHNAQRMRRLVEDLLDLSRIEAGSRRPHPDVVEFGAATREAWASLQPVPEKRGVGLIVPEEPVHGSADPAALMQILRNLLENASRYAPEGSDVEVMFRSENGGWTIEVSDHGPGIPPVHQERVFERFYRVDPARSREEGGTGLGLSIVKHLVAAHGGDIEIDSDIGVGTTVRFTLPAPAGDPGPAEAAVSAGPADASLE